MFDVGTFTALEIVEVELALGVAIDLQKRRISDWRNDLEMVEIFERQLETMKAVLSKFENALK